MPRRGTIARREVLPDPVYGNKLVTQVINKVLLDGKKSVAEQIVHGALETVRVKCMAAGICGSSASKKER